VIQLVDTRQAAFPPFESVKEQLRQQLAQDRLASFQRKVREAARIQ
jgi:parvulin-like peptidyl-prolyl isomerase